MRLSKEQKGSLELSSQNAEEQSTISRNIDGLKEEIAGACIKSNQLPSSVVLCGACKTRSPVEIREAFGCGIQDFGENYVQEAEPKMRALADLQIVWHFIGRIQSNKTKLIAENFDWVQTVDRLSIAKRLSDARADSSKKDQPLNVCIQVNVDEEEQKAGVLVEDLADLINETAQLPHLNLRGLMAIPEVPERESDSGPAFRKLNDLFHQYARPEIRCWDTLSMGMSGDFKAAIEAGATLIRLGTSIFGPR